MLLSIEDVAIKMLLKSKNIKLEIRST